MKKFKSKRQRGDCWFHKWRSVRSNGFVYYFQCKKCPARMILQAELSASHPIDFKFLVINNKNS